MVLGRIPRDLSPLVFGYGAIASSVISHAFSGLSGAHLNPAVPVALAGWGWVPFTADGWARLAVYVAGPLVGGTPRAGLYICLLSQAYALGKRD